MAEGRMHVNPGSSVLHRLEGKLITEKTKSQESCSQQIYSSLGTTCRCSPPRPFRDLHHSPVWAGFVLLPNNQKAALARRSTFTPSLQMALAQCLASSVGSRLDDVVTQSNLISPDHQGWLTDENSGQRRWCVVADMLFCVFEKEHSERPLEVLMLPGMQVNTLTYQSAKQDVLTVPVTGNRTVSGMHAHQLVITNEVLNEKHVYGADTHAAFDRWAVYLKAAANLDADVFLDSDEKSSCRSASSVSSRESGKHKGESKHTNRLNSGYVPSSRSAKHRLDYPTADPDKENKCKSLQKQNSAGNSDGVVFMLGDLNEDVSSVNTTSSGESSQKPETHKQKVKTVKHSRTLSMDSEQVSDNSSAKSPASESRLVRSNSIGGSFARSSFGAKIARKATSIRDKMFGAKVKDHHDVTLGSLFNIQISGHLHHKQLLKWIRLWCVISEGVLYGYKSEEPSEKAELALPLQECNLTTVETDKNKRMYIFKLCHLNAKNVYLSAGNIYEFDRWFDVFQKEAVFKTASSSLTSTPRNDPNTSLQIDILGNLISKSASPVATSSQTQRKRRQFRLKMNHSLDSSMSVSSQGSVTDNESEISEGYTPVKLHPHTQPQLVSKQPDQLDSSLSNFESNYLNGTQGDVKDTFWTEAYIKNYLPSQNSLGERSFAESETDIPESGDENEFTYEAKNHSTAARSAAYVVPRFGGVPRHDENLKQVWKNDKNYQLHAMKTKVATLPDRVSIFNRDLMGPNDEGLLLVTEEDSMKTCGSADSKNLVPDPDNSCKKSLVKSSSDASVDVKLVLQNLPLPSPHTPFYKDQENMTPRENLVLPIAARDIETATVSGYLEQFVTETEWISIWCVLNQSVLYLYGAPIDDETVDVIGLKGYRVTVLKPVGSKKYAFQLRGEDGDFHIFSTENKEDLHVWVPSIHRAISVARSNSQESQPIQPSNTESDPEKKLSDGNRVMQEKLELLEELQRQCNELKQGGQVGTSTEPSVLMKPAPKNTEKPENKNANEEIEQSIKDMTRLRKRRLSKQLKMDTLQRELFQQQMQRQDKGKKRFSLSLFEKSKPSKPTVNHPEAPPSPTQVHLQNQIKELSSEMSDIERDMSIQKIRQQLHGLMSGNTYVGALNIDSNETQSDPPQEEKSVNRFKSGIINLSSRTKVMAPKQDQFSVETSHENSSTADQKVTSETVTEIMTRPFRKRRDVQSLPYNVNEDDSYPGKLQPPVTSGGKKQEPGKATKLRNFINHGRSSSIDIGDLELKKSYTKSGPDRSSELDSKGKRKTFVDQNRNSVNGFSGSLDSEKTEVSSKTKTISPEVLAEIAAFEELIQEQTTCMV